MLAAYDALVAVSKQKPGGANGKLGSMSNMCWAGEGGMVLENWLDGPDMAVFSVSRFPGRNVIIMVAKRETRISPSGPRLLYVLFDAIGPSLSICVPESGGERM